MNCVARAFAILVLATPLLLACSRAPTAAASQAAAPPPVAAPPAPAKKYTMVCRNSQNGKKAECGTPGAVMVGMKED